MAAVSCHMSVSLDGFAAGPDQSLDNPLGVSGPAVHHWHFTADEPGHEASVPWRDELLSPKGAFIMGRNMFGPVRNPWDTHEPWQGWWGDEPPYHAPVFVLTHYEHEPIELTGTTFHFVTDGFDAALAAARDVAGDAAIEIAGGASAVRQALQAQAITELTLDISPVLLGRGESLFTDVTGATFEPVEAVHTPWATHVRYRVTY